MVVPYPVPVSKEFRDLVNFIRKRYKDVGRKPPSVVKISRFIVKKVDKEDLIRDVMVKF